MYAKLLIDIYTYIHTFIHSYIHTFMHSCIHTFLHADKGTCIYVNPCPATLSVGRRFVPGEPPRDAHEKSEHRVAQGALVLAQGLGFRI